MRRHNHKHGRDHSSFQYGFLAKVQKGIGIFFSFICLIGFTLTFNICLIGFTLTFNILWFIGILISLYVIYSGSKKEYYGS